MNLNSSKDNLYAKQKATIERFVFDESVANVFDDMIARSVPGYRAIMTMIGVLAKQYVTPNTSCYDLGCSTGASSLAIAENLTHQDFQIIAVDNSQAMLDQCQQNVQKFGFIKNVELRCDDITNIKIENASMVVLNFTLQFVLPHRRKNLLENIYQGLRPDGILIISEKITFNDPQQEAFQNALHHQFKQLNGYSSLEISQKRTALEDVLVPDTLEQHQARLSSVGFQKADVWFQCFNFISMVAQK